MYNVIKPICANKNSPGIFANKPIIKDIVNLNISNKFFRLVLNTCTVKPARAPLYIANHCL